MDPALVGGLIGTGTLLSFCTIIYLCERIYRPPSSPETLPLKPKLHWKMKNLLPVYNEEYRPESHSLGQGTYLELNRQSNLRSHILRVSRGSRVLSSEKPLSEVWWRMGALTKSCAVNWRIRRNLHHCLSGILAHVYRPPVDTHSSCVERPRALYWILWGANGLRLRRIYFHGNARRQTHACLPRFFRMNK